MMKALYSKVKSLDRDFLIFLLVGVFIGIGQSVEGATLSNFLKEKFDLGVLQRSLLEMPRELPGFLVFLIIGFLYALGDIRIAVVANVCAAVGMFFLGVVPFNYGLIIFFMFTYSMGGHVYMPLTNSIGMSFAKDENLGRKLGQLSATNTFALVVSSAVLWCLFNFLHIGYTAAFSIGAAAFLCAAFLLSRMSPRETTKRKTRFVFRKEYRLYYWLSFLFGGRKQIFLTFAPWVLVDVFKQPVTTMTILFFIISALGIFFKPMLGSLIDKVGEKKVLAGEAIGLIFICMGYAFAEDILPQGKAVFLIFACYILDQMLMAASMARATYLKKIIVEPEDLSPTLSAGVSIDHIASMTIPVLGGYMWYTSGSAGYKYVFAAGAVIALINLISVSMMKIKPRTELNQKGVGAGS